MAFSPFSPQPLLPKDGVEAVSKSDAGALQARPHEGRMRLKILGVHRDDLLLHAFMEGGVRARVDALAADLLAVAHRGAAA